MTMFRLPKEFELTEYGESYAADLIEGKLTPYELTIKPRMGLIESDGSFGRIAKYIIFLYNNDYEELYNSIDLGSAKAVQTLDGDLNTLITLGLGKGDWWSGEEYHKGRVGPGKGHLTKQTRLASLRGSKYDIIEYQEEGDVFCEMCQDYAALSHEHVPQDDEDLLYVKALKERSIRNEEERQRRLNENN